MHIMSRLGSVTLSDVLYGQEKRTVLLCSTYSCHTLHGGVKLKIIKSMWQTYEYENYCFLRPKCVKSHIHLHMILFSGGL